MGEGERPIAPIGGYVVSGGGAGTLWADLAGVHRSY